MKELVVRMRNALLHFLYKNVLKNIFFRIDPEEVHDRMIQVGVFLGKYALTRGMVRLLFSYRNKKLEQTLLGIKFANPIGLAGGFDKNAQLTDVFPAVGFGFAEVGSITGEPCAGNPKPRLWRLKKSRSLVVYYGLKNDGSEKIRARLRGKQFVIPIGTNVAKTNDPKTVTVQAGIADYAKAYAHFSDIGEYFTVNVSCPNAFGGQPFTDPRQLNRLLARLRKIPTRKPIFLKLSPDLERKTIDGIIRVAGKYAIAGFICSNLTKNRDAVNGEQVPEKGGLSGKRVEARANDLIAYVYKKTKGKYIIIGCGGVFSAEDAYVKLRHGASLVQMVTGMIFEGPQRISEINQGLVCLLERDGLATVREAIGSDMR